jgi:hypothetical protein
MVYPDHRTKENILVHAIEPNAIGNEFSKSNEFVVGYNK